MLNHTDFLRLKLDSYISPNNIVLDESNIGSMKPFPDTSWQTRSGLEETFARLDNLLHSFQPVWKPEPFQYLQLPWQDDYPKVVESLLALSDEELQHLQNTPEHLIQFIDDAFQLTGQLVELSHSERLSPNSIQESNCTHAPKKPIPDALTAGIPGRKWQQIEAFCNHLPSASHYTDWCCGKGHLARLIHFHKKAPVTGLEYNPTLCDKGNQLSEKLKVPVDIREQDVLAPIKDLSVLNRHVTALHACGDLHTRLLTQAVAHGSTALSLSPCCYHLTANESYQRLSNTLSSGAPMKLILSKEDLKLAVQETVTAPKRDQHHRRTLKQWRLAFDLIQRKVSGVDQYRHCPSLPYSSIHQGFESLVERFSEHLGLTISETLDYQYFLTKAESRLADVERLELARQGFRRALELWLIHDRALFLAQSGYRVRFGTFCDRSLTPRNLLIHAERI
ncbi:methyltransferase [Litoribrevibacter euphylliae]|uniref:Methyltransferase n=1 Tax=Litoribrevibacter euphylliae TaxID=1834034 RepID=A0ABV7H6X0_9GAMM